MRGLSLPQTNLQDQAARDKALQQMASMSSAQIVSASAIHNKAMGQGLAGLPGVPPSSVRPPYPGAPSVSLLLATLLSIAFRHLPPCWGGCRKPVLGAGLLLRLLSWCFFYVHRNHKVIREGRRWGCLFPKTELLNLGGGGDQSPLQIWPTVFADWISPFQTDLHRGLAQPNQL